MTIRNAVAPANFKHEELEAHTKLGRAFFVRTLMDSIGCLNPISHFGQGAVQIEVDTAKAFFNEDKKRFRLMCDLAGLEPSYAVKLHNDLAHHYRKGTFKKHKLNIKVVVERLVERV